MTQKDEGIDISKKTLKKYNTKKWVKDVKDRDNKKCVLCGADQHQDTPLLV